MYKTTLILTRITLIAKLLEMDFEEKMVKISYKTKMDFEMKGFNG